MTFLAHGACIGLGAHTVKIFATSSIAWTTKLLTGSCLAACVDAYDKGEQYGWKLNNKNQ